MVGFVTWTTGSEFVWWLSGPIGYGLVGLAWWQWIPDSQAGSVGAKSMRRSSRLLAVASAITALGYLAHFYGDLRFLYSFPDNNFYLPHFRLHVAGSAATGVGFLIAALGLWIASNAGRQPNPVPSDPDLARVSR